METKGVMGVTLERAIEVVLDLAKENVLSEGDNSDNELETWREEQLNSINIVEDFFTNHWIKEDE